MIDEKTKKLIDDMDYESMLQRWRHAPAGAPIFQGEVGKYFSEVMAKKKSEEPDGGVRASKNVGW